MGLVARSAFRQLAAAARRMTPRSQHLGRKKASTTTEAKHKRSGDHGKGSQQYYQFRDGFGPRESFFGTWVVGTVGSSGVLYTCLRDYVDKSIQLSREEMITFQMTLEKERMVEQHKKELQALGAGVQKVDKERGARETQSDQKDHDN
ncbi:uncharacterized protein [Miscanthus floridulus]|uniref:uncharacterized protein n=1 Tax=Miscanthus floridulus TaxID=154761 RepID=UPI00345978FC